MVDRETFLFKLPGKLYLGPFFLLSVIGDNIFDLWYTLHPNSNIIS